MFPSPGAHLTVLMDQSLLSRDIQALGRTFLHSTRLIERLQQHISTVSPSSTSWGACESMVCNTAISPACGIPQHWNLVMRFTYTTALEIIMKFYMTSCYTQSHNILNTKLIFPVLMQPLHMVCDRILFLCFTHLPFHPLTSSPHSFSATSMSILASMNPYLSSSFLPQTARKTTLWSVQHPLTTAACSSDQWKGGGGGG